MKINTNKNSYIFIFAIILVVVVAVLLSSTAISLKDKQKQNISQEKKQNILSSIRISVDRKQASKMFKKYIKFEYSLDMYGEEKKSIKAFDIDLSKEIKKEVKHQIFPLYIAEKEDNKYYIIPLRGNGLWDAIWGYIAIEDDLNTIYGVTFDHKAETPGLGAEINKLWFQEPFKGKKLFDKKGKYISVKTVKGGVKSLPEPQQIHVVDGISGGTITSDAVSAMIKERIANYLPYFKRLKKKYIK